MKKLILFSTLLCTLMASANDVADQISNYLRLRPLNESLFLLKANAVTKSVLSGKVKTAQELEIEISKLSRSIEVIDTAMRNSLIISSEELKKIGDREIENLIGIYNGLLSSFQGDLKNFATITLNKSEEIKELKVRLSKQLIELHESANIDLIKDYLKREFLKSLNINIDSNVQKVVSVLSSADKAFADLQRHLMQEKQKLENFDVEEQVEKITNTIDQDYKRAKAKYDEALAESKKVAEEGLKKAQSKIDLEIEKANNFYTDTVKQLREQQAYSSKQIHAIENAYNDAKDTWTKVKKLPNDINTQIAKIQNFNIQEEFSRLQSEQKYGLMVSAIGAVDPDAANAINNIYNGYQQLTQAYNLMSTALSGGLSMSTMALAMGPAGVAIMAFQAMSAFGNQDNGNAEMMKLILKEIQELKEMVRELSLDIKHEFKLVHQRFDHLEKLINDRFRDVDLELENQTELLEAINIAVVDIYRSMRAMGLENRIAFDFLYNQQLSHLSIDCANDIVDYKNESDLISCLRKLKNEVVNSYNAPYLTSEVDNRWGNNTNHYITAEDLEKNISAIASNAYELTNGHSITFPNLFRLKEANSNLLSLIDGILKSGPISQRVYDEIESILRYKLSANLDENLESISSLSRQNAKIYDEIIKPINYRHNILNFIKQLVSKRNEIASMLTNVRHEALSHILGFKDEIELKKYIDFHRIDTSYPKIDGPSDDLLKEFNDISNLKIALLKEQANRPFFEFQKFASVISLTDKNEGELIALSDVPSMQIYNKASIAACNPSSNLSGVSGLDLSKIAVPSELLKLDYNKGALKICVAAKRKIISKVILDRDRGEKQTYQNFQFYAKYAIVFNVMLNRQQDSVFSSMFSSEFDVTDDKLSQKEVFPYIFQFTIVNDQPQKLHYYGFYEGDHGVIGHRKDFRNLQSFVDAGVCDSSECKKTKSFGDFPVSLRTILQVGNNEKKYHVFEIKNEINLIEDVFNPAIGMNMHNLSTYLSRHFKKKEVDRADILNDEIGYQNLIATYNSTNDSIVTRNKSNNAFYGLGKILSIEPLVGFFSFYRDQKPTSKIFFQSNIDRIFKSQVKVSHFASKQSNYLVSMQARSYLSPNESLGGFQSRKYIELNNLLEQYTNIRNDFNAYMRLVHLDTFESNKILMTIFHSDDRSSRFSTTSDLMANIISYESGLEDNYINYFSDIAGLSLPSNDNPFEQIINEYEDKLIRLRLRNPKDLSWFQKTVNDIKEYL